MKTLKNIAFICAVLTYSSFTYASPSQFPSLKGEHPRLIATEADWQDVKDKIKTDEEFATFATNLLATADGLLEEEPSQYQKRGIRLLQVSRETLRRTLILSSAFRISGDARFARRAEQELLAVVAFPDWNHSHFLDVAEMTTAVAIGYDWLYDQLAPETGSAIRKAIINNALSQGLDPAAKHNNWYTRPTNWPVVCWSGLVFGALTIAENEPDLAAKALEMARANVGIGIEPYIPDGLYPEGPSYWSYGATYHILMNSALQTALGTQWELEGSGAFLSSSTVLTQQTGPTGLSFNFSDGAEKDAFQVALLWFSKYNDSPEILRPHSAAIKHLANNRNAFEESRFTALALLWWNTESKTASSTLPTAWHSNAEQPVTVLRGSWKDPNASDIACKGGSATISDSHLDAGSFVFESDGIRWARDLGPQDCNSLESKGINLWNRSQESERWTVFRLNNHSHNTLVIDGQLPWENNVFFVSFATKWFDGNAFTMNFTGSGGGKDNDSFNTIQGLFLTQSGSTHSKFNPQAIQPYTKNRRYWQYHGEPVLLVGGSVEDNFFQLPDLESQLDAVKAAGGNYVRNTMSDRRDHGSEVYPYKQLEDGRYDLDQWNPEDWIRFKNLLKGSLKRDIIVQIEIWDRFDHSRKMWEPSPYNPKNNINYSYDESGFDESYPVHPGKNRQPFFFTTPEQRNNRLLLGYQQRFVDKILSYSLDYDNVLYCLDNESSGQEAWSTYWSNFLHARADAANRAICLTEMWDNWDLKHKVHLRTLDHPERYDFIDASQNHHNSGEKHWNALMWTRNYIAAAPRPINSVKVYGASGNNFGHTDQEGVERFWRYLIGGAASVRFHRPHWGLGLSDKAIASIQSVRILERFLKLWNLRPAQELLGERDENEAYLAADPGNRYALYFTNGGSVSLDLSSYPEPFGINWISIDHGTLESTATVKGGGKRTITPPNNSGNWVAAIVPLPEKD